MPVIFADNFESNIVWTSQVKTPGETISIVTPGIFGAKAAQFTTDGKETGEMSYQEENLGQGLTDIYVRLYALYKDLPAAGKYSVPLDIRNRLAGGGTVAGVQVGAANSLTPRLYLYYNDAGGVKTVNTGIDLSPNIAYCLEIHAAVGAGTGLVQLYLNGAKVAEASNIDNLTTVGPATLIQAGERWFTGAVPHTVIIDEVVVDTAYIGPAGRTEALQQCVGPRIIDAQGKETVWRGNGGSYLFHAGANYQQAWQQHLPEVLAMGLNTVRLAFSFPDSTVDPATGHTAADVFDFNKMDWVIDFLTQHNIKAILDCHNYKDMAGDFGSQKLINDWVAVATHYSHDGRIVAYELFNEPESYTVATNITTPAEGIEAYRALTDAVRTVDPDRICIWGAEWFVTDLGQVLNILRPNVVYTIHRWYSQALSILTPEQLSYNSLAYAVEQRTKYDVPFWLGEFGSFSPFNNTNPEWNLAEQSCWRCEEQVVGWCLWSGGNAVSNQYVGFFPLKVYNTNLIPQPWNPPSPSFENYTSAIHGVDRAGPYELSLWHNNDTVTVSPGITIRYIRTRVVSGASKIIEDVTVQVTQPLTLTNYEGTTQYPGDWNLNVYVVFPGTPSPTPILRDAAKVGGILLLGLGAAVGIAKS